MLWKPVICCFACQCKPDGLHQVNIMYDGKKSWFILKEHYLSEDYEGFGHLQLYSVFVSRHVCFILIRSGKIVCCLQTLASMLQVSDICKACIKMKLLWLLASEDIRKILSKTLSNTLFIHLICAENKDGKKKIIINIAKNQMIPIFVGWPPGIVIVSFSCAQHCFIMILAKQSHSRGTYINGPYPEMTLSWLCVIVFFLPNLQAMLF